LPSSAAQTVADSATRAGHHRRTFKPKTPKLEASRTALIPTADDASGAINTASWTKSRTTPSTSLALSACS